MNNKTRNRGIIASRVKLEKAMLEAKIKTQAALAEKIASNENISSPPKDTIHRAFRQEKISQATLTRIAKALNVEPYTLYLSSEEAKVLQHSDFSKAAPATTSRYLLYSLFILLAVIAMVWIGFFSGAEKTIKQPSKNNPTPVLGSLSFVIYPFSDNASLLASPLKKAISNQLGTAIIAQSPDDKNKMSFELAKFYQADIVITLHANKVGRFLGLQFFIYFQGVEKLIWTESLLASALPFQQKQIVSNLIAAISKLTQSDDPQTYSRLAFIGVQAQDNYLNARDLLNKQSSEINIKRAQSLLDMVLADAPTFAQALAAKCESFIAESWNGNEKQLLENAISHCKKAIRLDPKNSYVAITMANALIRTGKLTDAISIYKKVLNSQPNNVEALSGLGNAYLSAYNEDQDNYQNALSEAKALTEKAVNIEADYWRFHSDLGVINFTAGDVKNALKHLEKSAELLPNELSFVNVGTLNFCQGNIDKSKVLYQKAINFAPQSHLGYEFLGTINHFLGNYQASIELREKAISLLNKENAIYQIWGSLADSYRLNHQNEKAEKAYLKALSIIERDQLRGSSSAAQNIHFYFYRYILTKIKPEKYFDKDYKSLAYNFASFMEKPLNNSAYITLAQIELIQGHPQNAKKALMESIRICPVFKDYLLFKELNLD